METDVGCPLGRNKWRCRAVHRYVASAVTS